MYYHLGQEIKRLRTYTEMSQTEFARLLKIHPQALSNCERGISGLPKRSFMVLKNKFPTSTESLIEAFYSDGSILVRAKIEKAFGKEWSKT